MCVGIYRNYRMFKKQIWQKLDQFKIKTVDYFHLLFKSAHYNYYRIETCKKDASGKIHCDISFDSYTALRQFQNKLRKISLGFGSLVTTTVIAAMIINLVTGPVLNSFAATFDFGQADWSGGASVDNASHASDQSGWTKYSSKDASVIAGAQISLATTSGSKVQSDDGSTNTGFNLSGRSFAQTQVAGIGAGASVALSQGAPSIDGSIVEGGENYSVVLKADGTVWATGVNNYGQLGDGTTVNKSTLVQVKGVGGVGFLTDVVQIAVGQYYTVAVKSDGTVHAWGFNNYGQLGDGTLVQKLTPVQVKGVGGVGYLTGVSRVAVNMQHSLALKSDGTVFAWGRNVFGELGNSTSNDSSTPVQVKGVGGVDYLTGVSQIAAGMYHSTALKSDGTVWSWGYNVNGQLGDNTADNKLTPVQTTDIGGVGFLTGVSNIEAGRHNSLALKSDGTVWSWGYNEFGQLGDNTVVEKHAPVQVKGAGGVGFLTNVVRINTADSFVLATKSDGTVWAWGYNSDKQLGDNTIVNKSAPVQVLGVSGIGFLSEVASVGAGSLHSLVIKTDGSVWAWGRGTNGQLGNDNILSQSFPIQAMIKSDTLSDFNGVASLSKGTYNFHTMAVKSDGTVWAWGKNDYGQLGNGSLLNKKNPTQVNGVDGLGFLTGVSKISNGFGHSLALKTDGTVFAWGYNGSGQLGDDTYIDKKVPLQIKGAGGIGYLSDISQVSAGTHHSLFLKTDGTVWSVGRNTEGQLGDNTVTTRKLIVQVKGPGGVGYLTDITQISAGSYYSLALKSDGTVWAWGVDDYGQLGDNAIANQSAPVQVKGPGGVGYLTGISQIAAGMYHSLASKSDGTAWSWGRGTYGQLGNGLFIDTLTPVQVKDVGGAGFLSSISYVSATPYSSFAIKTDGTALAWGYNANGQLGDNTTVDKNTPVQITGLAGIGYLTNASQVVGGMYHSSGLKADGVIYTWGDNTDGALGDDTLIAKNAPVIPQIYSLSAINVAGAAPYYTSGTYTSGAIDTGQKNTSWGSLNWTSTGADPGSCGDPIVDSRDGKTYNTVTIGTQCWTASNMNVGTKLADASIIPTNDSLIEKWCYDNSDANCNSDGGLYTWSEANNLAASCDTTTCTPPINNQGICPTGWHVPTDQEYMIMEESLGMCSGTGAGCSGATSWRGTDQGDKLKLGGSSGFNGIYSGFRYTNNTFNDLGATALIWSASQNDALMSWRRDISSGNSQVYRDYGLYKATGLSVRCVSDTAYQAGDPGSIVIKARSSANADMSGAADWASCGQIYNGASLTSASPNCVNAGDRYIQYQAVLATTDTSLTPALDDITINYSSYNAVNTLTSSAFNTQDTTNAMGNIVWTPGSLPAGTEIKFQVRTAPDSGGVPGAWTGWEGPDGTSGTFFTDNTGGQAMPANFSAGDDDQWFQYQITLVSDGVSAPVLSNVNVVYVVNATPEVSNVTASQISASQIVTTPMGDILAATGTVVVSADVLDLDTDSGTYDGGSMRNKVEISMKYFDTNSQTWENVATSSIQGMPDDFILDQISSSTPRNFSLIWNPSIEFGNQENSADFKIQILADDKEGANNIGSASSTVFAIDTKVPTADAAITSHLALKIDARQTDAMASDEALISIQASDISNLYYRYSLSSSTDAGLLQSDGVNSNSGQWIYNGDIQTGTTTIIKVVPVGVERVDTAFIQYADEFGNLDPNIYEVAIPQSITSIMIQDVTNTYIDPADVRFFLSWRESDMPTDGVNGSDALGEFKKCYVERADSPGTDDFVPTDVDYHVISSTTDKTINYLSDVNVIEGHHYYYRIYVEDGIGNFSYYTTQNDSNVVMHAVPNGVQDYGEGGGGTAAGVAPIISSVEIAEVLTTQASIVWNTDILSNSSVEYISVIGTTTPAVEDFVDAPFKGVATMLNNNEGLGKHRVVLDGLNSNTTYFFRVKSVSADGTEGTSFDETYHFATFDGPIIASSSINVQNKTNNSMTVIWNTDIPADSFVGYSTDSGMINPAPVEAGQNDSVTSHSVTLTNLMQGTRYYFYVKSGTAKDNKLNQYYSDMTTGDESAPAISNVASVAKRNSAIVSWQTDEQADSKILLGLSSNVYDQEIPDGIFTNAHMISLSNLEASTTYYYKVVSSDPNGNAATSTEHSFSTEGITLSNVIASTTSISSVVITWDTNEDTDSQVQYGTDLATLLLGGVLEPSMPSDSTKSHSITINDLAQATKYYYRVISTLDGYTIASPIYYFTSGDLTAPNISNVQAINISTNAATINWETDEASDSVVEWGTSTGSYLVSTSSAIMTKIHSVNIAGLDTFTDYYFRVLSSDANSNATTSVEYSFRTSSFKITNVFANSATTTATINWETDEAAGSQVEYTNNADFTGTSFSFFDATATTTHSIELTGLQDGAVYYYKVHSSKDGYNQESPIYTFSTSDQTAPVIDQQPQAVTIADETATVYWGTDEISDSTVYYGTTSGGPYLSVDVNRLTTLHFVKLNDLSASTTYYYYIESKDGGTNAATSTERTFTTLPTQVDHADLTNPGDPIVVQKTDIEAVITIPVSNTTATSKLCYATTQNIDIDNCAGQVISTPTRTHTYYLADLTASTTYYIKTKITDSERADIYFTSGEVAFQTRPALFVSDDLTTMQVQIETLEQQLADLQAGSYTEEEMQAKIAEINSQAIEIEALRAQLETANSRGGGGTLIIDKTDKVAPTISNVKIAEVGDVYAKITWNTNEDSSSMVGYGFSTSYDSAESNYQSYLKRTKGHTVYLKKLLPSTTYHFAAVSADSWGNMSSSPDYAVTTLAAGEETKNNVAMETKKETGNTLTKIQQMINDLLVSGKVNPEDIRAAIQKTGEPPMISGAGPEVSNITAKSVTISWKTNRKSNSIISYYVESMGRDTAEQVGNYSALVTDHTVNISNLAPGRKYIFTAQSIDALGNVGASGQESFETIGIPFVSEVSMSNITNSSVDISWLSNTETSSELDYGFTSAYGQTVSADANNFILNHGLRLNDLKPGQTYHFKAKGVSVKGDVISSDDYTFTTLSSFDVLTYSINKVTDKSANITWKTTNDSTSEIEYTNANTKVTDSVKSGDFTKKHDIKLNNLMPGTRYIFKIKGKDSHDQATESKEFEFSTLIDTQAPIIEYVQTDMALISKGDQNSVQAVVTWKTNELSTSEIIYTEGGAKNLPVLDSTKNNATSTGKKVATEEVHVGNDKFSIAKDGGSLTTKHVLVITDFKPSTVYTFKARSIDEAGNVSYSKDYTVLAPSKEESVLQIIIKTFESTFGWLKMK